MSERITASLASIYARESILASVISSVYDQVDQLHVYLNDYPSIPSFLTDSKIKVHSGEVLGNRGDVGKFYPVFNQHGYVLTLDDDIFYPRHYVDVMVERIEYYHRKAFVCIHGNLLPHNRMTSYYRDKKGLHFSKALQGDQFVDVPGTGTLGFHSSLYAFSDKDFPSPNMSDIWLYKICRQNNIPVICLARPEQWLRPAIIEFDPVSIYASSHKNDFFQTNVINTLREG